MKVEYLLAWEDKTWTTEVHEVPGAYPWKRMLEARLLLWAQDNLLEKPAYRQAVAVALYCYPFPE